ncbi:CDP-alcohol phosphatidyltransferase family protein, partial [Fulvivirga lutimaris]|uniref:CDP-alcohol phosphatidyltransferase family protein n=1 Tax=Fulvivirga lutimaris TaxID=1819566 RepID=UPI0016271722
KIFIEPTVDLVPWAIPANIITIISNWFFYIALYLSFDQEVLGKLNFIVIPVLLFTYLIGDHLDGAQAKRTGTGSALGEFCDHYFGSFNNGFLMLIFFNLFSITNIWLVAVVVLLSYMAHIVVFYEQFKTGWIFFEKLGSLEGVILGCFLIIAGYFPSIYDLYQMELVAGLTVMEVIMVLIVIGSALTFIKAIMRIPNVRYSIFMYLVIMILIAGFGVCLFSPSQLVFIMTLYSTAYLGKIMVGHLIDGIERSPGLFTPLFLIIIYTMPSLYEGNTFYVLMIYLSVSIMLLVYRTFQNLGQFWVWTNPSEK